MELKRHTLIDITDRGREVILAKLVGDGPDSPTLRGKYAPVLLPEIAGARIPGIVRREDGALHPERIPVGFSAPMSGSEGRMRVAAFARKEDVIRTVSPYELLAMVPVPSRNACTSALAVAHDQAQTLGLDLGVWGSAAMELYTGLPCTHHESDLDLLVAVAPCEALSHLLIKIESIEKHFALRIDIELELANGYGVHLKELFGRGREVLGKSLTDVALLSGPQILAELPNEKRVKISSSTAGAQYG